MSTEAGTEAPATAPCWPDDHDWLKGKTEIELTTRHVRAYWDAEIYDLDDKNKHDTIIERKDEWAVLFRVELQGRLWRCICGHWCFNVGFTAIGKGEDFDLSSVLPDPSVLQIKDWKGCDRLCIYLPVRVPGGLIPVERCGTVYEVAAWFELRCCGGCDDENSHLAVAGYESLGKYQFV
jgi:hypothetical protein